MSSFDRPTYSMTLPSLGLFYEGKLPGGEITYTPMTAREEKMLAGAKGSAGGVLDQILKSCLIMPQGMTVGQLLTADRFFALLMLRSTSYGSEYKFTMTCSSCAQKFPHKVTLDDTESFPVKVPEDGASEPFEVLLPVINDVIKFRLLRGDDEKAIERAANQSIARGEAVGDPTYTLRLARHIVSINDKEYDVSKMSEVNRYVEKLIGKDSVALRDAIEAADCGVDITLRLNCPRCDDYLEQSMPMTAEFFRPR